MHITARIRKLEKKLLANTPIWGVFTIGFYDNVIEQQQAQERLVNEYVGKGNPSPSHRIFINEIPSPKVKCVESFLHAFSR